MNREKAYNEACNAYASRVAGRGGIARMVRAIDAANDRGWYTIAETMADRLREIPLSVTLREVRPYDDVCVWQILIGTGGPADRVRVTTDIEGSIMSATYEYQNWFTPWIAPVDQDRDALLTFAALFYFGPVEVTVTGVSVP